MSAILVDLGDGDYGIVTDSDLRSKVVAGPLSPDDPVSAAMTHARGRRRPRTRPART